MSKKSIFNSKKVNIFQLTGVFLIILISFWSMGGCSNNSGDSGGGDSFPQPPEINSRNGVLSTILETIITTNFIENSETGEMDQVNTPTYNEALIGPTLRINPGDSIQIDL